MRYVLRASLAFAFFGAVTAAAEPPSGRKVDLKASDGTKLAATYYASERPGPGSCSSTSATKTDRAGTPSPRSSPRRASTF